MGHPVYKRCSVSVENPPIRSHGRLNTEWCLISQSGFTDLKLYSVQCTICTMINTVQCTICTMINRNIHKFIFYSQSQVKYKYVQNTYLHIFICRQFLSPPSQKLIWVLSIWYSLVIVCIFLVENRNKNISKISCFHKKNL